MFGWIISWSQFLPTLHLTYLPASLSRPVPPHRWLLCPQGHRRALLHQVSFPSSATRPVSAQVPGHVRHWLPLAPRPPGRPHPRPGPPYLRSCPGPPLPGAPRPQTLALPPAARGGRTQEARAANRRPFYNPLVTHNRPAPAAKAPASPPSRLFLEPTARKSFFRFKGKVEKSPALLGPVFPLFPSSGRGGGGHCVFSLTRSVYFPDLLRSALFLKETHSNDGQTWPSRLEGKLLTCVCGVAGPNSRPRW